MELELKMISWRGKWIVFSTREDPNIESSGITKKGDRWFLRVSSDRLGVVATPKLMMWTLKNGSENLIGKTFNTIIEVHPYDHHDYKGNKLILKQLKMIMLEYME